MSGATLFFAIAGMVEKVRSSVAGLDEPAISDTHPPARKRAESAEHYMKSMGVDGSLQFGRDMAQVIDSSVQEIINEVRTLVSDAST
jgi:hypothetical protein